MTPTPFEEYARAMLAMASQAPKTSEALCRWFDAFHAATAADLKRQRESRS